MTQHPYNPPGSVDDAEMIQCRTAMVETASILRAVGGDALPLACVIQEFLLGAVAEQDRPALLQRLLDSASGRMDLIVQQTMRRYAEGRALWPLRNTPEG